MPFLLLLEASEWNVRQNYDTSFVPNAAVCPIDLVWDKPAAESTRHFSTSEWPSNAANMSQTVILTTRPIIFWIHPISPFWATCIYFHLRFQWLIWLFYGFVIFQWTFVYCCNSSGTWFYAFIFVTCNFAISQLCFEIVKSWILTHLLLKVLLLHHFMCLCHFQRHWGSSDEGTLPYFDCGIWFVNSGIYLREFSLKPFGSSSDFTHSVYFTCSLRCCRPFWLMSGISIHTFFPPILVFFWDIVTEPISQCSKHMSDYKRIFFICYERFMWKCSQIAFLFLGKIPFVSATFKTN